MLKRAFDVVAALVGLTVLSPLLLLLGILVAATSEGPALFVQERIGRHGERFNLYKFRSMYVTGSGASITSAGESRITPVGRVMRSYKLDELPQLVNVLVGEMSVVGPRPEVPQFVDDPKFDFTGVLQVRPGLTDPASLAFRDEEDLLASADNPVELYRLEILPAKLALSTEYVRRANFWSDLRLVFETFLAAGQPGETASRGSNMEEKV